MLTEFPKNAWRLNELNLKMTVKLFEEIKDFLKIIRSKTSKNLVVTLAQPNHVTFYKGNFFIGNTVS